MTSTTGKAVELARTYITAMAKKDVGTIAAITAKDVVCTSPTTQITGIDPFRGFQEDFAQIIKGLTVLALYGDDDQAVVVYDVETHPVPHVITVELIKVKGGKLASTQIIYDPTPFASLMAGRPAP